MNLNNIPKNGNYADGVDRHNDNYSKIKLELKTLREKGENEKGYFESLSDLQLKYPSPPQGWQAYVRSEGSSTKYVVANVNSSGNWVLTSAEAPSVNVDLTGYAQLGGSEKTVKEVEGEVDVISVYNGTERVIPALSQQGFWVNTSGVIGVSSTGLNIYTHTVNPGEVYEIYAITGGVTTSVISAWKGNVFIANLLSGQVPGGGVAKGMVTIPDGIDEVKITGRYISLIKRTTADIKSTIEKNVILNYSDRLTEQDAVVITTTGAYGASVNMNSTPSLSCFGYNYMILRMPFFTTELSFGIAFYDSFGAYISGIPGPHGAVSPYGYKDVFIPIPAAAHTFRSCFYKSDVAAGAQFRCLLYPPDAGARKTYDIEQQLDLVPGTFTPAGEWSALSEQYIYRRRRTELFIEIDRLINDSVDIEFPAGVDYACLQYDDSRRRIDSDSLVYTTDVSIQLFHNTKYLKFVFRNTDESDFAGEKLTGCRIKYKSFNDKPVLKKNIAFAAGNFVRILIPVVYDGEMRVDWGVLQLPDNYDPDGDAARLIVMCHGSSIHYDGASTQIGAEGYWDVDYLLEEGFAVMDMDGNIFDHDHPHAHAPSTLQSYLRGYEFVMRNYNLKREILLQGTSMGSGPSTFLAYSSVPVKALFQFAPSAGVFSSFSNGTAANRAKYAEYYGIDDSGVTWTSNPAFTNAEWDCLAANIDKLIPSVIPWRNVFDLDIDTLLPYNRSPVGTNPGAHEDYKGRHKLYPVPLCIMHSTDDGISAVQWTQYVEAMCRNAGNPINVIYLSTGGHSVQNYGETEVVTKFGNQVTTTLSMRYMVEFFRKYCED